MSPYRHVTGVTDLAHAIIRCLFPTGGRLAMDCTLGRGRDADFLAGLFETVIAMDVQPSAVEAYAAPANVMKYCMDHAAIESFHAQADLILYNLGYLPGGDHRIATRPDSTLASLQGALSSLIPGGFCLIALYYGHDGGDEARQVLAFTKRLPSSEFAVLHHSFINRGNAPPSLLVIERKRE